MGAWADVHINSILFSSMTTWFRNNANIDIITDTNETTYLAYVMNP